MTVILALWRLGQEECKFEASVDYRVNLEVTLGNIETLSQKPNQTKTKIG
jgi:hypothetical protein